MDCFRIEHFETTYQTYLQELEGDVLAKAWMNICLTEEACYYHGTTELDKETIDKFIAKYGEDIPINELSEEKQAQVLEIRRMFPRKIGLLLTKSSNLFS